MKKAHSTPFSPDFKKRWAKLCVFCPDPFIGTPDACAHEPWDPAEYAHLLPAGVERLDDLWKLCRKHRAKLQEQAELNVPHQDDCPF